MRLNLALPLNIQVTMVDYIDNMLKEFKNHDRIKKNSVSPSA